MSILFAYGFLWPLLLFTAGPFYKVVAGLSFTVTSVLDWATAGVAPLQHEAAISIIIMVICCS